MLQAQKRTFDGNSSFKRQFFHKNRLNFFLEFLLFSRKEKDKNEELEVMCLLKVEICLCERRRERESLSLCARLLP